MWALFIAALQLEARNSSARLMCAVMKGAVCHSPTMKLRKKKAAAMPRMLPIRP
jgi:hypothetical protein